MKYYLVRDNIKYYYRTEEHMKKALSDSGMSIMSYAEAAVNIKTNEVLKCRYTMEQIFDNLDLDNTENIMLKQSMTHFKLQAMTGLILNICDNLNDMPISEEWADKTAEKIMAMVELPEPTELTDKYMELTERYVAAQESNNQKLEDEIADELDKVWYEMRTDERRTVDVLVAKFMSGRDVTANK